MIRLAEHKHETEGKPIEKLAAPLKAFFPLSQHIGKIALAQVSVGDTVLIGQRIAAAHTHLSAHVHASVSGTVKAIQDHPHPLLGRCKAIVVENDGRDARMPLKRLTQQEVDVLSVEEIRSLVQAAGIVGMGGASFPTHIKLQPPRVLETMIVNGVECEPYLTADNRLMLERTKEILSGMALVKKCVGAKKVIIAIEDNKPEAIKAFRDLSVAGVYEVRVLKSFYPQGGEKQLIQNILKREIPSGKLPFDIGVLVQNVSTLFAIYEAVYEGKPVYERVVTVSGSCLSNPKNLLVRIGTPIADLINACAPLRKEAVKIIAGGPMMGVAQYSLETPVIKATNGILLLPSEEVLDHEVGDCIRCGRCVEACPVGLEPCILSLSSEREKWSLAKAYHCLDCIECGLCNFVCPQKINLVQSIKRAKVRMPK